MKHGDFLTLKEVAAHFGVSVAAVYDLVRAGRLVGFQLGRRWLVRRSELDAYVRRAEEAAAADAAIRTAPLPPPPLRVRQPRGTPPLRPYVQGEKWV
jgi:excisionase family DNA binding protein